MRSITTAIATTVALVLLLGVADTHAKPSQDVTLQALKDFYAASYNANAPWKVATNWNVGTNYCTWYGVTCGADGYTVIGLRLSQNNLDGRVVGLGNLTELITLHLAENLLSFDVAVLTPLVNVRELLLGFVELGAPCVWPYSGSSWGGRPMLCVGGAPDFGGIYTAYSPTARNDLRGNMTAVLNAMLGLTKLTLIGSIELAFTEQSWCKHIDMEYVHMTTLPMIIGGLPECMSRMTKLWSISIVVTSLSSLPMSLSNMSSLIRATFNNNMLRGKIFPAIPPNIFMLNVADNTGLTGPLPEMQAWPYDPASPNTIWNKIEFFSTMNNYGIVGEFPTSYGTARNLKVLYLTGNSITGSLPSNPSWPLMLLMGLSGTRLNGTLPDIFDRMFTIYTSALAPPVNGALVPGVPRPFAMVYFYAESTRMTGGLPPSLLRSVALGTLILKNASITMDVTALFKAGSMMPSLTELQLSGNNLYGDLDASAICTAIPSITRLSLDNNRLTGKLPACMTNVAMPKLTRLYLSSNNLTGTIPTGITTMTSLAVLDLSNNSFIGSLPATITKMTSLSMLNVNNNDLQGTIFDELWKLMQLPLLSQIDVSYNYYYSGISGFAWSSTASPVTAQFASLKSLNMAYNQITGPIPDIFMATRSQINYFNVEGNQITGPLPDMSMMDVIIAANNNYADAGSLPYWFSTTPYLVSTGPGGTYQCPVLEGTKKKAVITLDASYYGYKYCRCSANYFGQPPNCRPCLENGICNGREDSQMIIPAGFYPTPNRSQPVALIRCLDNPVASEPDYCNPKSEANFTCAEGYEGRLCSKCSDNYYNRQSQCVKCPPLAVSIVAVVILVIGVIVLFLLMRFLPVGKEELIVGIKVLIVYIQTANAIIAKAGLRWPSTMMGLNRAFDVIGVDISFFSCFASKSVFDLPMTAQVQSIVVLSLIVLLLLIFVVVVFQMMSWVEAHASREAGQPAQMTSEMFEEDSPDGTPRDSNGLEWHPRDFTDGVDAFSQSRSVFETADATVKAIKPKFLLMRAMFLAVKFLYLPVAVTVMQVFQCETDPGDGLRYMHYSPAQECRFSDPTYGRNFVVAIIIIPVYIVAFPIFVLITSLMFRADRKIVVNIWYFMYMEFKRMKTPYLLWSTLRQLMLSIILVIIPKEESLPLLTVLLVVMLVVHIHQLPFRLSVHNFLEGLVLVSLLLDLMLGLTSSGEDKSNDALTSALLIILQVALLGTIVYCLIIHGAYKKQPRRECPWPFARYIIARVPWSESTLVRELSPNATPQAVPVDDASDDFGSNDGTGTRYMTQEHADGVHTPGDSQV